MRRYTLKLEMDKYCETKLISKMDIYFETERVCCKLLYFSFLNKYVFIISHYETEGVWKFVFLLQKSMATLALINPFFL